MKELKEMMQSCFTYGGIDRGTHNFEKYISPYIERLGAARFDKAYEKYAKELRENYLVEYCTSTDCEGGIYHSLIKVK